MFLEGGYPWSGVRQGTYSRVNLGSIELTASGSVQSSALGDCSRLLLGKESRTDRSCTKFEFQILCTAPGKTLCKFILDENCLP
jgi:hypothetical protein